MSKTNRIKGFIFVLLLAILLGVNAKSVSAQDTSSVLYVPLIGITSVPNPLALPKGPGDVTYNYAVKNFLSEVALSNIQVVDDKCSSIKFVTGDDNGNSMLDYSETWRYSCTTKLTGTTQSTITATGTANNITATHKAYATVVVGSNDPAPLVSIINITKVAYPLSLPMGGGKITFTYKVNNPGIVPLSGVIVTDDKCKSLSGKLGDTNGNNLLDVNEVWIYTCTATLTRTTTNTVNVIAYANGFKALGEATITVKVASSSLSFPNAGSTLDFKLTAWKVLAGILAALILLLVLKKKNKLEKSRRRRR
ncbi:MAG TPA: hypothetical protein VFI61_03910 [Patescibacteria group bacterium]|nr:hypothetical protein [Patescibacteria group bacterium]